jgi:hypothetical protein
VILSADAFPERGDLFVKRNPGLQRGFDRRFFVIVQDIDASPPRFDFARASASSAWSSSGQFSTRLRMSLVC